MSVRANSLFGPISVPTSFTSSGSASIENPYWKDERVGRVEFSVKGDRRRNLTGRGLRNEFEYFRLEGAEDGVIPGFLLWSLVQPMDRKVFDQQMKLMGRVTDGDPVQLDRLYREYLAGGLSRGMAAIALNRILDNEAMKRKFDPRVSESRVEYVVRSLVAFHGISGEKVTAAEVRRYAESAGTERLYAYLKETVGERDVRFNIDWMFNEGMELEQSSLSSQADASLWKETRLEFVKLPATLDEFRTAVRDKLSAQYRPLLRMAVWGELIQEKYPFISFDTLFSVRSTEMKKMYDALGEKSFTVQESVAEIQELIIEGVKAEAYRKGLDEKLATTGKALYQKLSEEIQSGALKQEDVQSRLTEARRIELQRIFSELGSEFSSEMSSGEVVIRVVTKKFSSKDETNAPVLGGETDPLTAREAQERSIALNPFFGASGVFPKQQIPSSEGQQVIIFLQELTMMDKEVLPITDPKVDRVLRGRLQSKVQGKVFRELAYRLFKDNPVMLSVSTCSDSLWPCTDVDAETLATSLFPEQLYPGAELGNYGPAHPIKNTLLEPQLMDRVMSISIEALQTVFSIPNPGPLRAPKPVASSTPSANSLRQ